MANRNAFSIAWKLALMAAILGLVISNGWALYWLANEDPNVAFVLWYVVLAIWVAATYYVLFGKLIPVRWDASILILYFAFGTIFYWAASDTALLNAGLNASIGAGAGQIPAFLLASEDQLISSGFVLLGAPPWLAVALTYWAVPAILIFVTLAFIAPRRAQSTVRRFLQI